MVRIGISVEGVTEERFVKKVLAPYLLGKDIYLTPISVGGGVNLDRVADELKSMAYSFDYVSTLYDFYGFRNKEIGETKESLEAKISNAVLPGVRSKLIPYIQMYEFEGVLFSCPDKIGRILQESRVRDWAAAVLREFNNNPELINDSKETAPSKRLEANSGYRKTTHGPDIALEIGIDKIREMCSGFHVWISELESKV